MNEQNIDPMTTSLNDFGRLYTNLSSSSLLHLGVLNLSHSKL